MYSQLEITTRCNFSCWYCAGRAMQQEDMAWETFTSIVDSISQPGGIVSLQGEGEPSLHPRFWEMAQYVLSKGHVPYTIVNGSRIDAQRFAQMFPRIGVSIDTLDPVQAESIGRYNLVKVLANVEALCASMGARRIVVMTVDLGQPLDELKAWVRLRGFASHVVQPLMRKQDYGRHYPQVAGQAKEGQPTGSQAPYEPIRIHPRSISQPRAAQTCRFLHQDALRYYTWDGLALPCCFIKDTEGIESIASLRELMAQGQVPKGCAGCAEKSPVKQEASIPNPLTV